MHEICTISSTYLHCCLFLFILFLSIYILLHIFNAFSAAMLLFYVKHFELFCTWNVLQINLTLTLEKYEIYQTIPFWGINFKIIPTLTSAFMKLFVDPRQDAQFCLLVAVTSWTTGSVSWIGPLMSNWATNTHLLIVTHFVSSLSIYRFYHHSGVVERTKKLILFLNFPLCLWSVEPGSFLLIVRLWMVEISWNTSELNTIMELSASKKWLICFTCFYEITEGFTDTTSTSMKQKFLTLNLLQPRETP